jgi:uncharacterized sulfatase
MRIRPHATLVLLAVTAAFSAVAGPPNVVLIICDDQAWFDFGFMGSNEIKTPHLDQLARESAVFSRGYVPSSVCRPSLATMITGHYPQTHRFGVGLDGLRASPTIVRQRFERYSPLPKLLQPSNYRSLQTGKWWEGNYALAGFTQGMTTGSPVPGSRGANDDPAAGHQGLGALDRGMSYLAGAEGLRIGREGLEPIYDFIRNRGDQPFFLWYAPMLPHTPHNPPERLLKRYRVPGRPETIARYMAMCEWFDETCGQLLDSLDREGLGDNMLVVFAVDNGYVQLTGINWFDKRSKLSPYEAGLRTPILLRWPERIRPARYEAPVHTIDLVPTILAACGVAPPDDLPGINLLTICGGQPPPRDAIFGATFRHRPANGTRPSKPDDTVDYRWCLADPWKLILPRAAGAPPQLFDIVADPHEEHDLAAKHPDRVRKLKAKIDEWWSPIVDLNGKTESSFKQIRTAEKVRE